MVYIVGQDHTSKSYWKCKQLKFIADKYKAFHNLHDVTTEQMVAQVRVRNGVDLCKSQMNLQVCLKCYSGHCGIFYVPIPYQYFLTYTYMSSVKTEVGKVLQSFSLLNFNNFMFLD